MQPLFPPGRRELSGPFSHCSHRHWLHPAHRSCSQAELPRCIRGQLPHWAAEPQGRITSQTLLLLNNAQGGVCASSSLPGGALGKGTVFSQKNGRGEENLKSINHTAATLWKDQSGGLCRHYLGRGQTPLSGMIQTDWPKFPGFWHCHHHPHHSGKGQEGSHVRQGRDRTSAAPQAVQPHRKGSR